MWDAIAAAVPGKTPEDVRRHYELLVEDVDGIEAGRVPLLVYAGDAGPDDGGGSGGGGGKKGSGVDKGSSKSAEQERRKGIAWTEDEHRFSDSLSRSHLAA
ncbi:transcription factor SRM1-like isoform X3 [Lolium perenne]|uniref:transcription factor SRM1-like isoform X3 n=1 Tax=Lolium perenne TaxID=4522 RepID=UPI003A9985D4